MPQMMQLAVIIGTSFEQEFALYCQDMLTTKICWNIDSAFYLVTLSIHNLGSNSSE